MAGCAKDCNISIALTIYNEIYICTNIYFKKINDRKTGSDQTMAWVI